MYSVHTFIEFTGLTCGHCLSLLHRDSGGSMGIHVHMAYFSTYMYKPMLYFVEVHLHMYVHVHVCVQYTVHIGYEYGSSYIHVHVLTVTKQETCMRC